MMLFCKMIGAGIILQSKHRESWGSWARLLGLPGGTLGVQWECLGGLGGYLRRCTVSWSLQGASSPFLPYSRTRRTRAAPPSPSGIHKKNNQKKRPDFELLWDPTRNFLENPGNRPWNEQGTVRRRK